MKKYALNKISTRAPKDLEKSDIKKKTEKLIKRVGELQALLYADGRYALLIVIQGMDASGKDGVIREVFDAVNPQGCQVISYKAPTEEELAHDFLWRIHQKTPRKGMLHIFNRSHYEDVLITRVRGWVDDDTANKRFSYINSFEQNLVDAGTTVLKFYLHISQEEQAERFKERQTNPAKMWKFNPKDLKESKKWDDYMEAYEDMLQNCSPEIPWTVVPSDQNWYKEYLIAETIVESLEKLELRYPEIEKKKG